MALWKCQLQEATILAETMFHYSFIKCEVTFWWLPYYDKWEGLFKTKFKYLSLDEKYDFNFDFMNSFDSFTFKIEEIREKFTREYNYYFNAVWC
jgi:hypothetical protein